MEENSAFQKEKLQEEYNDSYWEKHYTICRERIPVFLEKVADKILNTGKYLNVVRQCGEYGNLRNKICTVVALTCFITERNISHLCIINV